jgi:Na+/H+-translocating membrane pyrophosphatase
MTHIDTTWWLGLTVACLALLNLGVCVAVSRSGNYTRTQVLIQSALVWLVPALGAILVALFLRSDGTSSTRAGSFIPPTDVPGGASGDLGGSGVHAP